MGCFTEDRIKLLREGHDLDDLEQLHIHNCDNCMEAYLLNADIDVPSRENIVWDDATQQWLPTK